MRSHCIDFHNFEKEEVEVFFEEHDDEIRDEIRERDDSTTVNDLIKNTRDIPIRVEMLSNYDCINSCWLESQGGFRYKESYFGDMIDTLHLNPAKVKKALTEKGYTVYAHFRTRSIVTARSRCLTRTSARSWRIPAAEPICLPISGL